MHFKILALTFSVVFHPLLLPTLVCLVVFYLVPIPPLWIPEKAKAVMLLLVFVMTFVAPNLGILLYYFFGTVKSLQMHSREDRFYPFIFTTCLYAIITYLFATAKSEIFQFVQVLVWFLGGVTITLLVVSVVTFYWKISAHSAGIAGVLGFWFALAYRYQEAYLLYPVLATLLLAGFLLTCRLYLNAHTLAQIGAGFGVGFVINFCTVLVAVW